MYLVKNKNINKIYKMTKNPSVNKINVKASRLEKNPKMFSPTQCAGRGGVPAGMDPVVGQVQQAAEARQVLALGHHVRQYAETRAQTSR